MQQTTNAATKTIAKKIFLVGMMGSGKTHWANQLSNLTHYPFADLDKEIEISYKLPISQIFKHFGEDAFRKREKKVLSIAAHNPNISIIATGGGAPFFYNNMALMNYTGTTIWIDEGFNTIFQRLEKEKSARPLIQHLTTTQLADFLKQQYAKRFPFYSQAKFRLQPHQLNLATILSII